MLYGDDFNANVELAEDGAALSLQEAARAAAAAAAASAAVAGSPMHRSYSMAPPPSLAELKASQREVRLRDGRRRITPMHTP